MSANPFRDTDVQSMPVARPKEPYPYVLYSFAMIVMAGWGAVIGAYALAPVVKTIGLDSRAHGFGAAIGGFIVLGAIVLWRIFRELCYPRGGGA